VNVAGAELDLAIRSIGAILGAVLMVWGFVTYRIARSRRARAAAIVAIAAGLILLDVALFIAPIALGRTG
jgi:hypothetical protein